MAEKIDFENRRISNFKGLVTLTLTLDRVTRHTVVHHSSTSTYTPNFIGIGKTFCGRKDGHLTHVIRSTLRSRPKNGQIFHKFNTWSDRQTGDNKALVIGEFLGEQTRDDHLCEAEKSDLFLDAAASQHSATDQPVGKVDLEFTAKQCFKHHSTEFTVKHLIFVCI